MCLRCVCYLKSSKTRTYSQALPAIILWWHCRWLSADNICHSYTSVLLEILRRLCVRKVTLTASTLITYV